MAQESDLNFACPLPITDYKKIVMAHGGGGKLTQQLIQKLFVPLFNNEFLGALHDGAILRLNGTRFAFSTDSYVVQPIFFPGGDIGKLAINGTVNDLAMCGAEPLFISAAFIIEEGFEMDSLWQIVLSMQNSANKIGVKLVTGDTKVVERGKGDKIFITTTGIGIIGKDVDIQPNRLRVNDQIILSGPIGLHGIAIMSVREGIEFSSKIESDTAPLNDLVKTMLNASKEIHVLRDPTRGGIASTLNELASQSNLGMKIFEELIPIPDEVQGACEILGLDPLYIANEGVLLAFVPSHASEKVLDAMRKHSLGTNSVIIGSVVEEHPGVVVMKSRVGGSRVVSMFSGEQLPRIC